MHTLKVAVVELPEGGAGDPFDDFKRVLGSRLHLLPPFNQRTVEVPFGLHHPVWVDDPGFDLDQHIRRITVPAPGGSQEMDQAVATIASVPLSRDKPLWEIWMLDGLEGGWVGFVAKMHHALADGMASASLLANFMGAETPGAPSPQDPKTPIPSRSRLLRDAIVDMPRRAVGLAPLVGRTLQGAVALARSKRGRFVAARPFGTERTRFNHTLSPQRIFATTDLSLDAVKAVKNALGVTLNDVVLSIAGTAIHNDLAEAGETPNRPLIAAVPVSIALDCAEPRLSGNRLSNIFTSLCTDRSDPVARVRAIHTATGAARSAHMTFGAQAMQDWAEYAPAGPYRWGIRLFSRLGLADRMRPAANVIVSNVRGPASTLEIEGARLRRLYSVGPILDGLGLNLTAWSYAGRLGFAALADRSVTSDLHSLTEGLHTALAELEAAI
jgi:diacylglycerol O-acyltransferase